MRRGRSASRRGGGRCRAAAVAAAVAGIATAACGAAEEGEAGAGEAAASAESPADSAELVADRLMEALGGQEAWDGTAYLAFRWIVERDGEIVSDRHHAWDRREGTYRVAFERDGRPHVAIFEVDEVRVDSALGKVPAGRAWAEGTELSGPAADSVLARAYGAFINDTYWVLMPYKWRDPGVHMSYEGRRELDDGREYDVVHLAFEPDVGLTNDEYWGFVDPETGLMHAWQYHLQNQEEPGPVIRWEGWRQVGSIRLAPERRWPDGQVRIRFEELRAAPEVPEGALAPPGA